MTTTRAFTKGHGTENDFVLLPDLDGTADVTADQVRHIADRRDGIGGDAVIRVVPTSAVPEVADQADRARWFMDYRNADGSAVEMCGNGARVFAAYLRREGLEEADTFHIATRSGVKAVRFDGDRIAVNLGSYRLLDSDTAEANGSDCMVNLPDGPLPGLSLELGNPHTVVALPDYVVLESLDLTTAPEVSPVPSDGTNVELVRPISAGHIAMRVHERGVGETRSCGTGAAAAALATRWWAGEVSDDRVWQVDVPGGTVWVRALPASEVELSGPAALVADGILTL
jgi:diaminopimelate epimerase